MSGGKVGLFLYGTLRESEALSGLLPAATTRYGATLPGRLYYAPHTNGYPVLVPPSEAGERVTGELVWLDFNDQDFQYVTLMEISSGYSATWCTVALTIGGEAPALAFTWHPNDGVGGRVPNDDWAQRNTGRVTYACRGCNAHYPDPDAADACEWDHDLADAMQAAVGRDGK